MGANSRQYLQIRVEEEQYNQLPPEIQEQLTIHTVVVEEEDYSHDELWNSLKKQSVKAYKALKDREYDLRHNFKR